MSRLKIGDTECNPRHPSSLFKVVSRRRNEQKSKVETKDKTDEAGNPENPRKKGRVQS